MPSGWGLHLSVGIALIEIRTFFLCAHTYQALNLVFTFIEIHSGPSAIEKNVPSYDEDIAAVMMRRARCLHVASYSTDPASNLIMLSKEYSQDKSNGKADVSNNQQLWRLWNWIERVEFLCEDAYELEESGEQSLWPVKSIVDAGVTHLLQMDNEVDEGKKSESLQCITYDSSIRG